MARRRIATGIALAAALVLGLLVPVTAVAPAAAADGANFDPGMIISDDTFYNAGAMNVGQVQAFLSEKGASCSPNSLPCVKDITLSYAQRNADQYCGVLPSASNVRAADMFVAVAIACGINPQVLLVLVEKEQSLVSRSNPSDYSYRYATGFACPDSPPGCDDALSGFVTQVYLAAKQFNRYRINPGSYNFQAGRVNNILYNPNPACGSSGVFIQNQATAGLYNYTPYQPNASALANLYGSGDSCGSYGNRNFWRMFTDWFAGSSNLLSNASFEQGSYRWGFVNGPIDRLVAGPTTAAQSGQHFLSMYAARSGLSISQDSAVLVQARDTFTATIWVASGSPGKTFTGDLAIWALGGQAELAVRSFTVGSTWTPVEVTIDITKPGHTALRLEVYLSTTDALLSMDSASLLKTVPQPPRDDLVLQSASFETGGGGWEFKNGFANRAVYNFGAGAQSGSYILAANTAVPGRSVGQDVAVQAYAGESFTASIWLRSSNPAQPFSGTLALWGLGASAEAASTPFKVGGEWTQISATVTLAQASVSKLRFEVYMDSVGLDLYFDNATLRRVLNANPSFERDASAWGTGQTANVLSRVVATASLDAVDGRALAISAPNFVSFATDVKRRTSVGEVYTATIWLRSATVGNPWDGEVVLWGIGGAGEATVVPVSIGDSWTPVTVQLTIAQQSHGSLRIEVYSKSPGEAVYVDAVALR